MEKYPSVEEADNRIRKITLWVYSTGSCGSLHDRIRKAYPKAAETKIEEKEAAKVTSTVFAAGCSFYKIVLLFFLRSLSG